jgi:hypothetical protein
MPGKMRPHGNSIFRRTPLRLEILPCTGSLAGRLPIEVRDQLAKSGAGMNAVSVTVTEQLEWRIGGASESP